MGKIPFAVYNRAPRVIGQGDIAGFYSPRLSTKACDKIISLPSLRPSALGHHPVQGCYRLLRRMAFPKLAPKAFKPPAGYLGSLSNRSSRPFHACSTWQTDGVYRDLTNMRVRIPWIQALRESEKEAETMPGKPADPASRDLKAKRMADSFHRVVRGNSSCPVADTPG